MLTSNDAQLIPEKVLRLAYSLGVHVDCVHADLEGACEECIIAFNVAFDSYYGHADNPDQALMMIINDILEDRNLDPK